MDSLLRIVKRHILSQIQRERTSCWLTPVLNFNSRPSSRPLYMEQAVNAFTPDESEEQRIIQDRIRKYLGNSLSTTDVQQHEHLAPDELEEQSVY